MSDTVCLALCMVTVSLLKRRKTSLTCHNSGLGEFLESPSKEVTFTKDSSPLLEINLTVSTIIECLSGCKAHY